MRITIELPDDVKGLEYVMVDKNGYEERKPVTFGMFKRVEDQNEYE